MVRSACMIEPHCLITLGDRLGGKGFRKSFWQGKNGFVAGVLCFIRPPGDEIPSRKRDPGRYAGARLSPKRLLPQPEGPVGRNLSQVSGKLEQIALAG